MIIRDNLHQYNFNDSYSIFHHSKICKNNNCYTESEAIARSIISLFLQGMNFIKRVWPRIFTRGREREKYFTKNGRISRVVWSASASFFNVSRIFVNSIFFSKNEDEFLFFIVNEHVPSLCEIVWGGKMRFFTDFLISFRFRTPM